MRISITPATVLSGGTIVVEYSAAEGEQSILGRWQREPVAQWNSCDDDSCAQTGWLRLGAKPALLPMGPYDRAYLPYDDREKKDPDGPDTFQIPHDVNGRHQVCATLRTVADGTEFASCATVEVHLVPTVRTGERSGWFEIDPTHPPAPSDSTLRVLVHTTNCDRSTTVGEAQVVSSDTEIAVRMPVEAVDCSAAIPPSGPTPATVELAEPIGDRVVLDATCFWQFDSVFHCSDDRGQRWPVP